MKEENKGQDRQTNVTIGEGVMKEEAFKDFCAALDNREKDGSIPHCPAPVRKCLWLEIEMKAEDVRDAVTKWVLTGEKTELTIPELTVSEAFWARPLTILKGSNVKKSNEQRKVISTSMLERVRKMNYIAAAFAIDWLRREPQKALMVLHRGMI